MDVVVPELSNDTMDEAKHKLLSENLSIGKIFTEDREGYKGRIIDQEPKAGTTVKELTAVNLYFGDEQSPTGGDGGVPGINQSVRVTGLFIYLQGSFGNKVEVGLIILQGIQQKRSS